MSGLTITITITITMTRGNDQKNKQHAINGSTKAVVVFAT